MGESVLKHHHHHHQQHPSKSWGVLAYAFNLSTRESDRRHGWICSQRGQHSEFQARQEYIVRLCLKNKKQNPTNQPNKQTKKQTKPNKKPTNQQTNQSTYQPIKNQPGCNWKTLDGRPKWKIKLCNYLKKIWECIFLTSACPVVFGMELQGHEGWGK